MAFKAPANTSTGRSSSFPSAGGLKKTGMTPPRAPPRPLPECRSHYPELMSDSSSPIPFRVGQAIDVHSFAKESEPDKASSTGLESSSPALDTPDEESSRGTKSLWLAGLEWPGETPLEGHSDGDVAAHAVCDALLSATGLGEMGTVFGTDRPQWRGASGEQFLREVCRMLSEAGWRIGNVSVQVIGKKPRMAKRLPEACERMSQILGAPVQVSATTTDGLGFTGRGEGLAASAVALVVRAEA